MVVGVKSCATVTWRLPLPARVWLWMRENAPPPGRTFALNRPIVGEKCGNPGWVSRIVRLPAARRRPKPDEVTPLPPVPDSGTPAPSISRDSSVPPLPMSPAGVIAVE